jgi:hypothetical protein
MLRPLQGDCSDPRGKSVQVKLACGLKLLLRNLVNLEVVSGQSSDLACICNRTNQLSFTVTAFASGSPFRRGCSEKGLISVPWRSRLNPFLPQETEIH